MVCVFACVSSCAISQISEGSVALVLDLSFIISCSDMFCVSTDLTVDLGVLFNA